MHMKCTFINLPFCQFEKKKWHCKQILHTSICTCNVHFTYITRIKMNILLYIVMYIVMYNKSALKRRIDVPQMYCVNYIGSYISKCVKGTFDGPSNVHYIVHSIVHCNVHWRQIVQTLNVHFMYILFRTFSCTTNAHRHDITLVRCTRTAKNHSSKLHNRECLNILVFVVVFSFFGDG